jgi:hypothetical protein
MSLKTFMGNFLSFEQRLSVSFSDAYAVHFDITEQWQENDTTEGNLLIVGLQTTVWSSRHNHFAWLANCPKYLLVHKIGKTGKPSKVIYMWPLEHGKHVTGKMSVVDYDIAQTFHALYPKLRCYSIYDRHQLEIAQDNVESFGGYGWSLSNIPDVVSRWMGGNPYFWDLHHKSQVELADRIYQGRQKNLQLLADLYRDEDLSGVFSAVMSGAGRKSSEPGSYKEMCTEVAEKMAEVNRIERYIATTPRIGLDWTDAQELRDAEKALNSAVTKYRDYLPRTGIGTVDLMSCYYEVHGKPFS